MTEKDMEQALAKVKEAKKQVAIAQLKLKEARKAFKKAEQEFLRFVTANS